jgi:ABC-type multidrug transport system ATPase subunit
MPSALQADAVTVDIAGHQLLGATSMRLQLGQLVGLIGPSGAGKSTLLRVLAGVTEPSAGAVQIEGGPLSLHTDRVGYVPFGDLLHDRLTVREALAYVAALRLPGGSNVELVSERVSDVLGELRMGSRADHVVGSLSGGERRRAAVGAELIGRPSVLLLDEPATGLDPGLERRLMRLLRQLADDGRAVLVATHATANLGLCDEVAVMAQDGNVRFLGTPAALLNEFGVTDFEEIYDVLDLSPDEHLDDAAAPRAPVAPAADRGPRQVAPMLAQTRVLADRYARVLTRDRRTLAVLLGQAPVIGLAIGLVLPPSSLSQPGIGGYFGIMVAYLLMVASTWLGVISSCREIVKERAIVAREVAAGLRLDAYMLAKCAVLFPLAAAQALMVAIVVALVQPLGTSPVQLLGVLGLCVLTAWAAVGMGLWLSAYARSADQATSAVPLLLIPQLLLAGALIPVAQMIVPAQAVTYLALSRWSFTGIGDLIGLGDQVSGNLGAVTGFDDSFFTQPVVTCAIALVVFTVVALSAAGLKLDRDLGSRAPRR